MQRLQINIDDETEQYQLYEGDLQDMMNSLSEKKIQKIKNIYHISKLQIRSKKYDEIINNRAKLSYPKPKLQEMLDNQKDLNSRIKNTMLKLKEDYS